MIHTVLSIMKEMNVHEKKPTTSAGTPSDKMLAWLHRAGQDLRADGGPGFAFVGPWWPPGPRHEVVWGAGARLAGSGGRVQATVRGHLGSCSHSPAERQQGPPAFPYPRHHQRRGSNIPSELSSVSPSPSWWEQCRLQPVPMSMQRTAKRREQNGTAEKPDHPYSPWVGAFALFLL